MCKQAQSRQLYLQNLLLPQSACSFQKFLAGQLPQASMYVCVYA